MMRTSFPLILVLPRSTTLCRSTPRRLIYYGHPILTRGTFQPLSKKRRSGFQWNGWMGGCGDRGGDDGDGGGGGG